MTQALKKRIREIPGDDGWTKGEDRPLEIAKEMMERGIDEDTVVHWITDIFWFAAAEYGG